jgi:tripartite-type tricarboxylate transporter receptor subunit TctC
MKLPRRQFLHLAAGAAALPAVSDVARAQSYPTRPVRIIVGAAPSGTYDIMARLIDEWLSERLGQQFVIENRPGAGTTIDTEAVVKAPSDGYTLLLVGAAAATPLPTNVMNSRRLMAMLNPMTEAARVSRLGLTAAILQGGFSIS